MISVSSDPVTGARFDLHAHRFSWILKNGPIPQGLVVRHHCPGGDNRACVNPDHLMIGTPRQNVEDRIAWGVVLRGENHPMAKLTESHVRAIRKSLAMGESRSSLAHQYGVSVDTIRMIAMNIHWSHVT